MPWSVASSSQLPGQTGSGRQGLPQPGAGLVDDGAPPVAIVRASRCAWRSWVAVQGLSPSQTTRATAAPGTVLQPEGEGGGGTGEIAFGHGQDAALGVVGIGGEEQPRAGGADDADAAERRDRAGWCRRTC